VVAANLGEGPSSSTRVSGKQTVTTDPRGVGERVDAHKDGRKKH